LLSSETFEAFSRISLANNDDCFDGDSSEKSSIDWSIESIVQIYVRCRLGILERFESALFGDKDRQHERLRRYLWKVPRNVHCSWSQASVSYL